MLDKIIIRGAREHNLKNIDVEIPHGALTIVSGVSGSGKSSLAFDTLYAEGQRRYIESLSTYAKQFLERIAHPDVDDVSGISPSIAIEQKNNTRSSRSTVGTTTEIYDYLRLIFARVGSTYCPRDKTEVVRYEPDDVIASVMESHCDQALLVVAKVPLGDKRAVTIERLIQNGYMRILHRGKVERLQEVSLKQLGRAKTLSLVLDRITAASSHRTRVSEAIEASYKLADGWVWFVDEQGNETAFTSHLVCELCDRTFEEPRPILFSFNTPFGACPHCRGFGNRMEFDEGLIIPDRRRTIRGGAVEPWASEKFEYHFNELLKFCRKRKISVDVPFAKLPLKAQRSILDGDGGFTGVIPFLEELREKSYKKYARFFTRRYLSFNECRRCRGGRLREEAYFVQLGGLTIGDVASMVPADVLAFVNNLKLSKRQEEIAHDVLLELRSRLQFLLDVGLYYLTLDRLTRTLSGGESQRINLANSLGANLIGVLYVLDEPSVGLHPRDTEKLTRVLLELRDRGNTVVVVEHDIDIIERADYLIDLGPGAGRNGGEVLYQGPLKNARNPASKTIRYLSEGLPVRPPHGSKPADAGSIRLEGVTEHNLNDVDVDFPIGRFNVVTGVSGSGKSTLVCGILNTALRVGNVRRAHGFKRIRGNEVVSRVMLVDQTPIGRTPRSNPITYIKAFSHIRDVFAATRLAKRRAYASGRFSFNVAGGRCSRCDGMGFERIEMHFMADMFVRCPDCEGTRFNRETLEVKYHGMNLAQVLDLTVEEAVALFADIRPLVARLKMLQKVGLGYLQLGQPSTTLSGGESQRIKVARELAENTSGGCVYILDEPTTGLHIDDIDVLIGVLRELVDNGNTVVVVEHNPQVILQADHVIDLGPEGGDDGGRIIAQGTPAQIMRTKGSHTGTYLRRIGRSQRKSALAK